MNVDVDDIGDGSDSSDADGLRVERTFESATEALHAVQDYALSLGKAVKLKQRSGVHRLIVCSSEGCEFSVRVYRKRRVDKTYGPWYISSIASDHVNCLSTSNPTRRQITELPTFESAVRADSGVTAGALIEQIQFRDGIALGKKRRTLYRAKEAVGDIGKQTLAQSYGKIPSYLSLFAELNPGSIALAEQDSCGRFKRAIVIVKVFADGVLARQGVVGVDCSHSKCPSYSGMQMHLVSRDGNLRNVTIAFGLVEAEDIDNYRWFFTVLDKHGYNFRGLPMFCDRSGSLISVATEMCLNLKYCTLHIIRNLLGRFRKFTHNHKNLVWSLQSAESEELYKSRLSWIEMELGSDVKQYLADIPPERWCVYANIGEVPLYGWRTSNFVESVFGTQLEKGMRKLQPYGFIQAMCSSFVDECFKRSENARTWREKDLILTPGAEKLHRKQSSIIGQYSVQHASSDVCYVHAVSNSVRIRRRVNFRDGSCTCEYIDQMGMPCRHLIAALESAGKLSDVYTYFQPCYKVSVYADAFHGQAVYTPIETDIAQDPEWKPAAFKKKTGRPKTKRIRSVGEDGDSTSQRCSNCHQRGHNKRSCTHQAGV